MWFKKLRTPKTHPTPFGEFTKKNGGWEGTIEVNNEMVCISTDDVKGEPNPRLLSVVPMIQQNLPQFETMCRQSIDVLSSEYELSFVNIDDVNPRYDFWLYFSSIDKFFPEWVVIVEFKDEKILSWWSSD